MMFWEIIATVMSGFLFAGLVLPLRLIFKQLPKWIVPAAAGIGMIAFQVYSEYSWADDTIAKLPEGAVVVATVPSSSWYRPWSYPKPQVLQFVALDKTSIKTSPDSPTSKQAMLYFFERRAATQTLPVSVDCTQPQLSFSPQMNQAVLRELCP